MTDLNSFFYVDGINDVMAAYVNRLLAASLRSEYQNIETLSGTRTLSDADTPILRFNCNGADRIAKMPTADAVNNKPFLVYNATTSGNYALSLQNNGGTIVHAVLKPSEFAYLVPNGLGAYEAVGRPFSRILTPAQITANQNDYYPTGAGYADVIRLSSDAARDVTGLAFVAAGKPVLLLNVGTQNIVLKDESTSSVAANRFALSADITMLPDQGALAWYDTTSSRVRIVGGGGGGGTWGSITGTLSDQSDLDKALNMPDGTIKNGKLSVTVASNNITVAIKTLAGTNPSSTDPVYVWINGSKRTITAALSLTINAGTSTFNAGSAELATKEIDYFAYLSWKAASSAVVILASRVPYATVYSDFSGTATAWDYAAYSSAPASTDDVVIVGRYAATLSAGAGYTWTVPTFTSTKLIQRPIWHTRHLTWVPAHVAGGAGYTNAPTTNKALYMFDRVFCEIETAFTYNATSGGSSYSRLSSPATPADNAIALSCLNATSGAGGQAQTESGYIYCYKYDGTTPIVNSQKIGINGKFRIKS